MLSSILPRKNLANHPQLAIHQCAGTWGASQSGRHGSEMVKSRIHRFGWYQMQVTANCSNSSVGILEPWTSFLNLTLEDVVNQLITPGAYIQPLATITAGQGFEGCMGVEAQWQLPKWQSVHQLQIWMIWGVQLEAVYQIDLKDRKLKWDRDWWFHHITPDFRVTSMGQNCLVEAWKMSKTQFFDPAVSQVCTWAVEI